MNNLYINNQQNDAKRKNIFNEISNTKLTPMNRIHLYVILSFSFFMIILIFDYKDNIHGGGQHGRLKHLR